MKFLFKIFRMSQNIKKIKNMLQLWLKKSRETKRFQTIMAAKCKAQIAEIEWRGEIQDMNEIQSWAGIIKINFEILFLLQIIEDVIADISVNLNEAIEQILNDFDNLSPRKKTSMKSLKPKKRKLEKAQTKASKKLKLQKPDEFFDDEAAEGNFIFI